MIIGALMNTRGLTELVILSIGLSLGVLSDRTFAMMVIMALATTVMAAPIVNRLVSRDDLVGALIGPVGGGDGAARVAGAGGAGQPAQRGEPGRRGGADDGGRRPAELLLVRLIPTPRAPEFSTGLLDVESQVAAAVDSMRSLVDQAAASGVEARPISFLSDDVGPDLARIAADQKCDAILLGWHRASLARHIVQALVHSTFRLAPCDVAVFVDRGGRGIPAGGDRPVAVVLSDGAGGGDAAATAVGRRPRREPLGGRPPDRLRRRRRHGRRGPTRRPPRPWRPGRRGPPGERRLGRPGLTPTGTAAPSPRASWARRPSPWSPSAADWATSRDFGRPAEALVEEAGCPLLVVRPAPNVNAAGLVPEGTRPAHA